jgi:hypothetical protein
MPLGPPRFREQVTKLGSNIKPGAIAGTVNQFTNGKITSKVNLLWTGVQTSVRFQRCWDNTNIPERGARGLKTFRSGGNLTILDCTVPGNDAQSVVGSNFGSGVAFENRKEYTGLFGQPILTSDPQQLQYATGGGNKLLNHPLIPSITSSMENAAWNIRPKLEKASIANAIYELKDVPGMLRQTSKFFSDSWNFLSGNFGGIRQLPVRASEDFLNFQFGWRPFVNDIVQLCDTVIFAKQYIDQIVAENNTWVKRSRSLEVEDTTTKLQSFLGYGLAPSGIDIFQLCKLDSSGAAGRWELWQDVHRRVWAVGEFKFYRPEFDPIQPDQYEQIVHVRRMITLLGLRINPTHLWAAIPWTWLIDWFTNLGDLVRRVDEQFNDGMVSKYLYIMQQKTTTVRSIHSIFFWSGTKELSFQRTISSKQRRFADSPYGFVLGGSLSASQYSILAALGLSRNVHFTRS